MSCRLTDGYSHGGITKFIVDLRETFIHLPFSNECLDDTKTAQSFFYLTDAITPFRLGVEGTLLEFLANLSNTSSQQRNHQEGEQGELPTHGEHRTYIHQDEDRVLDQHIEGGGDTAINFIHIGTHTCQDVALSLFREEREGQRKNFLVDVGTDVPNNACTKWHQTGRTAKISGGLQQGE